MEKLNQAWAINGSCPHFLQLEKKVMFFHECAKDKLIKYWNNTRPNNCEVGKIN